MKNKNILHILPKFSDYGGTPNKIKLLVKYKSKHINYIFVTFDNIEEKSLLRNFLNKKSLIINIKISKFNILYNFLKIYKKIKDKNLDCICVHFFKSSFYGFLLSIILKKRLIIFENGIIDYKSIIKELFFYFIGLKAAKIISNSIDTFENIKKRYSVNKIVIVHNGLEKQNYLSSSNKNNQKEIFNILFIGGLIKLRNLTILVKSLKLLNINFKLSIVGDGPEKNNLIFLAKKLNLKNKIEFKGYKNKNFIRGNHNNYDLFVSCTEKEGFGYAVFEAICFKIPILIYKNSTYSKLINNNDNANYFDKINEVSVSDNIIKIYKNLEKAKIKAIELEKYCLTKFNIYNFTKKIESLY